MGEMEFRNFLYSKDVFTIINRLWRSVHFSQLSFLVYLFTLRIPSDDLLLRRAFKGDRLLEFVPQNEKVLGGVRSVGDTSCLVMKFSFRKDLPRGCILRRFCMCGAASSTSRKLCPHRRVWPVIAARDKPGHSLYPSTLVPILIGT